MALVNYGVVSPSLTLTVQMELSDADSERIVAYLMAATSFGSVTENVQSEVPNPAWSPDQKDPDDPPEFIQVQAWVTRQASPEETAANYAKAILAQLLEQTVAFERAQAAKVAAESVAPIQFA